MRDIVEPKQIREKTISAPEGKDRNRDFFVTDSEFMNDDGLFTVLRRMPDNGGELSIAKDRALRPTEMANK